ncbi:class F sortase [Streptomyces sp. NPDC059398]|uniref:class F sortase n=1 Tax=Streptomyces sp. NPDC059398 TaxID=3346820 RepID=UPI0036C043F2
MDRHVPAGVRPPPTETTGTVRRGAVAMLVTLAVCLAVALISNGVLAQGPPPQPGAAQGFPAHGRASAADGAATPPVAPLPPSVPERVRIPALGVDAPLMALRLEAGGRLAAPPDNARNLAGWYQDGASPGSMGTAVIAGHVDDEHGPAVFYGLGSLKKGNTVRVERADGATAVFTIDAVEAYTAQEFPNRKVYGTAARPELRLITCGGGFDRKSGHYLGNVVAYAHLTGEG